GTSVLHAAVSTPRIAPRGARAVDSFWSALGISSFEPPRVGAASSSRFLHSRVHILSFTVSHNLRIRAAGGAVGYHHESTACTDWHQNDRCSRGNITRTWRNTNWSAQAGAVDNSEGHDFRPPA